MQLYLKPFYKKDKWIIETNTPFKQDADFETLTHRYYIKAGFDLFKIQDEQETDEKVTTVGGIFFRYNDIYNDDIDITEIADVMDTEYTEDIFQAINTLEEYALLPGCDLEECELICYLNRVYVYPQYRNKGIATYLFENLQHIFEYITGESTKFAIVYPKPQEPTKDGWECVNDDDNSMLDKMVSKLNQSDFYPIEDTGFYIKYFKQSPL